MKYPRRDVDFGSLDPNAEPLWKLCLEIEKNPNIPDKNKHLAIGVLRSMLYLKHNKGYIAEMAYLRTTNRDAFQEAKNTDPYMFDQDFAPSKDVIRAQPYQELQTKAGILTANLAFHISGYAGTSSVEESIIKVEENVLEVEAAAKGLLSEGLLNQEEHIKNFAMKIKDSPSGCTAERLMDSQMYAAEVIISQGQKVKTQFSKMITEGDVGSRISGEVQSQAEALLAYMELFSSKNGEIITFVNGTEFEIKPENYKAIIKEAANELEESFGMDSAIPKDFSENVWNQGMEKMLSVANVKLAEGNTDIYNLSFDSPDEAQYYLNYLRASGLEGIDRSKLSVNEQGGSFTLSSYQLAMLNSLIPAKPQANQAEEKKQDEAKGPAGRSVLVQRLKAAIDVSVTPQRYQALANMIHYQGGKDLSKIQVVHEGVTSSVIDNSAYYGSGLGHLGFYESIPAELKNINSPENLEPLLAWAEQKAKDKSFNRIKEKFNITDPATLQRLEANLNVLYTQYHDVSKIKDATLDLKNMLIHARLAKKFPDAYAKNKDNVQNIINDHLSGKIDAKKAQEALSSYFPEANPAKLNSILSKFAILRRIENPEQVAKKVENEVVGVLHDQFAQEIELLNNVQRVTLKGDETLYRGITSGAFTDEQVVAAFNDFHRAIGATSERSGPAAGFGAHQIKTRWNHIQHPTFGGRIASDATATTLDPKVAFDYALGKNGGGTNEGWVFEIRPKPGDTAVSLVNYELRGDKYAEIDLTQIDPKEIKAVHKIRRNDDGTTEIIQTLENPNYKKRPYDEVDPGLLQKGVIVSQAGYKDGTPARNLTITTPGETAPTSWNVFNNAGYLRHIKDKEVIEEGMVDLPTAEEVKTNRIAAHQAREMQPEQSPDELAQILCDIIRKPYPSQEAKRQDVEKLLKAGANLEYKESYAGATALHVGCSLGSGGVGTGDPKLVELLIEYGANPNTLDALGRTPLHMAAMNNYADVYKYLTELDPSKNTNSGKPYIKADETIVYNYAGNFKTPRMSLDEAQNHAKSVQATNLRDELISSIQENNMKKFDAALSRLESADIHDLNGLTPLHYAAQKGNVVMIKALLAKGALVNEVAGHLHEISLPLHRAVASGNPEAVNALLEAGADPKSKLAGSQFPSPIEFAASQPQFSHISQLLNDKITPPKPIDTSASVVQASSEPPPSKPNITPLRVPLNYGRDYESDDIDNILINALSLYPEKSTDFWELKISRPTSNDPMSVVVNSKIEGEGIALPDNSDLVLNLEKELAKHKNDVPPHVIVCYANVGGNHWATYACNTQGDIMAINSLPGYTEHNKSAIDAMKAAIHNSLGKTVNDADVVRIVSQATNDKFYQKDSNICGAFTIEMALSITSEPFKDQEKRLGSELAALVADQNGYTRLREQHERLHTNLSSNVKKESTPNESALPKDAKKSGESVPLFTAVPTNAKKPGLGSYVARFEDYTDAARAANIPVAPPVQPNATTIGTQSLFSSTVPGPVPALNASVSSDEPSDPLSTGRVLTHSAPSALNPPVARIVPQEVATNPNISFKEVANAIVSYDAAKRQALGIKGVDASQMNNALPRLMVDMYCTDAKDDTKKLYVEPAENQAGVKYSIEPSTDAAENKKMIEQAIRVAIDNAKPGDDLNIPNDAENKAEIEVILDKVMKDTFRDQYKPGVYKIPGGEAPAPRDSSTLSL